MRTCIDGAARLQKDQLATDDFRGAKWAFFSAYILYSEGLLPRAVELAAAVSLHGSYLWLQIRDPMPYSACQIRSSVSYWFQ
jgi:hypothetical protein